VSRLRWVDQHSVHLSVPTLVQRTFRYGMNERRETYERIQSASDRKVDFIMLGCPHNSIEQMELIGNRCSAPTLPAVA